MSSSLSQINLAGGKSLFVWPGGGNAGAKVVHIRDLHEGNTESRYKIDVARRSYDVKQQVRHDRVKGEYYMSKTHEGAKVPAKRDAATDAQYKKFFGVEARA